MKINTSKSSRPSAHSQLSFGLSLKEKDLYSLKRFCEGGFNGVALKAVKAFGKKGEPKSLAIVGLAKSGKTHLLKGLYLKQKAGGSAAFASTADITAGTKKGMKEFFKKLYSKRIVLIDDICSAKGNELFYQELFHLFNRLVNKGSRIAVTMSVSPARATFIPDYLSTRLLSGMVATILRPSDEEKKAILKKIAADRQIALTPMAIRFIMERSARSIPDLLKVISQVEALADSRGKRIGLQLIRRVIKSNVG